MLYYPPFTKRNRRIDMKIKRYTTGERPETCSEDE